MSSSRKGIVERHFSIDARQLYRSGGLIAGNRYTLGWSINKNHRLHLYVLAKEGCLHVQSRYCTLGSECLFGNESIRLDQTECNFGVHRYWFLCPSRSCSRRVAILYWEGSFLCRNCLDLIYQRQMESPSTRQAHKVDSIRKKLGWELGFLNGMGWKPKHMHWLTFGELARLHEREVKKLKYLLATEFGLLESAADLTDTIKEGTRA